MLLVEVELLCGNKEEAIKLSETMNRIGKLAGKETVCILTNMDEPLGTSVGNNLEVIEAIKALKGDMEEDVKVVVLELGSYMIKLAGIGEDIEENKQKILENIQNGKAYNKFKELVKNQGGDISYLEDVNKFEKAKFIIPVISDKDGYVEKINAREVGVISGFLGAGRVRKEDNIDESVGIVLCKKVSNEVKVGDILCYVHANDENLGNEAVSKLKETYKISKEKIEEPKAIIGIVK